MKRASFLRTMAVALLAGFVDVERVLPRVAGAEPDLEDHVRCELCNDTGHVVVSIRPQFGGLTTRPEGGYLPAPDGPQLVSKPCPRGCGNLWSPIKQERPDAFEVHFHSWAEIGTLELPEAMP